jgi:hypothetical protein
LNQAVRGTGEDAAEPDQSGSARLIELMLPAGAVLTPCHASRFRSDSPQRGGGEGGYICQGSWRGTSPAKPPLC